MKKIKLESTLRTAGPCFVARFLGAMRPRKESNARPLHQPYQSPKTVAIPEPMWVAMGQNPNRTPSEHPNPTTQIGSNMVHLPQNGIPLVLTQNHASRIMKADIRSYLLQGDCPLLAFIHPGFDCGSACEIVCLPSNDKSLQKSGDIE